mmetsp:Transcript_1461/g.4289  ORF Transcript_1461/g.4289 Transcript_1461/m.4289 type:complete len:203 (+) Transcript_1461:1410-2018(+)
MRFTTGRCGVAGVVVGSSLRRLLCDLFVEPVGDGAECDLAREVGREAEDARGEARKGDGAGPGFQSGVQATLVAFAQQRNVPFRRRWLLESEARTGDVRHEASRQAVPPRQQRRRASFQRPEAADARPHHRQTFGAEPRPRRTMDDVVHARVAGSEAAEAVVVRRVHDHVHREPRDVAAPHQQLWGGRFHERQPHRLLLDLS